MMRSAVLLVITALWAPLGCGDENDRPASKPRPAPADAGSAARVHAISPDAGAPSARPAGGPVLDVALGEAGPTQLAAGDRLAAIDSLDELPAALARFPARALSPAPAPAVVAPLDAPLEGEARLKGPPTAPTSPMSGARIIKAKPLAAGVAIVMNRGSEVGVRPGWVGRLLGPGGKLVPDGTFSVTKVTTQTSMARLPGWTRDRLRDIRQVSLAAPP